ncbi:MAG: crosslink repair DNA glycosylase YcaQ family protein, partial [Acidobacteriota bacterium]
RIALGDAVRSLGEVGKKVGLSSTLPPTLRRLEFAGRIERRLEDDRLDHERYRWQRATRPIDEAWDAKPARLRTLAARRFVEATGIAAVDAFATWSGFGKRDARAALDDAQLEPISIDGVEGDFRAVPELLAEARSIDASLRHRPSDPIFLPFEDHLLAAFGGPAFWVDPRHHALPTPTWGSGPSTLGTARRAWIRPILIGDRVRACWDWHPTERRIVVAPFDVDSSAERTHLRAAADRFGDALATELGHGRIHSIDGEKTARRRLERLAALAPLI